MAKRTAKKPVKPIPKQPVKARSQEEITAEIAKLKEIMPKVPAYSGFGDNNKAAVRAQIRALEEEWDHEDVYAHGLGQYAEGIASAAVEWRDRPDGDTESPSESWDPMVKP